MDKIHKQKVKKTVLWTIFMFFVVCIFFAAVVPELDPESDCGMYVFMGIFGVFIAGIFVIDFKIAKLRICPKCDEASGKVVEKKVLVANTHDTEGHGVYRCRCSKCGYEWEEEFTILSGIEEADRSSSDDDSDSDYGGSSSGSWGGGSSSGGGAGRSF